MIALNIPLWGKALAVLALVSALWGGYAVWRHSVYQEGYNAAMADVRIENAEVVDRAVARRVIRDDCRARGGVWSQASRQCREP